MKCLCLTQIWSITGIFHSARKCRITHDSVCRPQAGSFHKCSRHLCVAVYRPYNRITHWLQRFKTTPQIRTLCPLKSPTDWLKQKLREDGNMATELKISHRPRWHQQLLSKEARYHWCTYKHYVCVVHLSKNSHAACEENILQRDVLAWGKKGSSLNSFCNPAKTKEPCSLSYVLIKGLIKSFLQPN